MKKITAVLLALFVLLSCGAALAATEYSADDPTYIRYETPYVGRTAEGNVALRQSAYSRGQIVDTLRKGVKLTVKGAKYDQDSVLWYETETTARKSGWVMADQLTFEDAAASTAGGDALGGLLGGLLSSGNYVGNAKTHVYHLPSCRVLPNPENRVYFGTKREAAAQGYRACGVCKP